MTELEIRILKIGAAPSLSGQSTLTYYIGCKDNEIHLRLAENTSGGLFSKEWVSLGRVNHLLSGEQPVTSSSLHTLFQGKSINSGGFLLAVLKQVGLVRTIEGKRRSYVGCAPSTFTQAMQALMESEVSLDATKTPPPKKKSKKKETP